ncbi:MAG: alpha/beta fold hydrolase [Chloroflexota bacterium]|nr:alpha/beta fold hydrolase [Chloroflexota bacterium]
MRRRHIIAISGALLLCTAAYLGIGAYGYLRFTQVDNSRCQRASTNTPTDFRSFSSSRSDFDTSPYLMRSYEEVIIESRDDKVELSGWFIPTTETTDISNTPTIVVIAGLHGCKKHYRSLTIAGMLNRNGFNVLMVDLRNHGDSAKDNGMHAAGTKEYKDILGAWDWLVQEKGIAKEKIGVFGSSLGGRTTIIAMAKEPEIAAGLTVGSAGGFEERARFELERNGIPTFLLAGGLFMGELLTGDDVAAIDAEEVAREIGERPFFIMHGDSDTRVDITLAYHLEATIKEGGGDPEFWVMPGVEHSLDVYEIPEEFERRIVDFFARALSRKDEPPADN